MNALSDLIGGLLGWLGNFIEWLFDWIPRYEIVQWNERGVFYPAGRRPYEVGPEKRSCPVWVRWLLLRNVLPFGRRLHLFPTRWWLPMCRLRGLHWYCPNLSEIEKHHVSRMVLDIESLPLETKDGRQCEVGMVLTYFITDVCKFETENFDADESMAEAAQGEMQDIITGSSWGDLQGRTEEGTRLGNKLRGRMNKALEKFGVEIESCRPTEQIQLARAIRLFGVDNGASISLGG